MIDFHLNTESSNYGEINTNAVLQEEHGNRISDIIMNIPYITIVGIVGHNLAKSLGKHVCLCIFRAICQYKSIELKYTERLRYVIRTYVRSFLRPLFSGRCPFKVQASKLAIEEQFQESSEEDKKEDEEEEEKEPRFEYRTRSSTCEG